MQIYQRICYLNFIRNEKIFYKSKHILKQTSERQMLKLVKKAGLLIRIFKVKGGRL